MKYPRLPYKMPRTWGRRLVNFVIKTMKKLLLFLLSTIAISTNAMYIDVVGSSFNSIDPVELGSSQWVDVKLVGSLSTSDSIRLFIMHMEGTKHSLTTKVYSKRYFMDFEYLPKNTDGTYRVYLELPISYPIGDFILTGLSPTKVSGKIGEPNGIEDEMAAPRGEIEKTEYYDLNGRAVENPTGIYIARIYYRNGAIVSRKRIGL